jgi:hypothetical protein
MRPVIASMTLPLMSSAVSRENGKGGPVAPAITWEAMGSTAMSSMEMSTRSTITMYPAAA